MNKRMQVTMDPEMQRQAHDKAAKLGISLAEYMRRLVAGDLGKPKKKADVSVIFDLVDEGPPTDIARDKDKLIGEAVWGDYLRSVGRKSRRSSQSKTSRR